MTGQLKGKVNYSTQGNIAILEVDNPPVNPLSSGVRAGLSEYILKANSDDSIEGIILTGAGRSFIAGADISEFGQKPDGPDLHTALREIEFSKKPVVAAINGTALGGGLETALVCNYRIGTNKAIVGLPEVNLGLLPGAGGTQTLPRAIGERRAKELILTGQVFTAEQALEWGLANAVYSAEELLPAALKTAQAIAANAPVAVRQAKQAISKGPSMGLADGLAFEIESYNRTIPTQDRREGVSAFNEKRAPDFKGE